MDPRVEKTLLKLRKSATSALSTKAVCDALEAACDVPSLAAPADQVYFLDAGYRLRESGS